MPAFALGPVPLHLRPRDSYGRGLDVESPGTHRTGAAGFMFAPPEGHGFKDADGALRGHAHGIIIHGPDLRGAYLIYPLVWEHKAVNAKNWRAVERDG